MLQKHTCSGLRFVTITRYTAKKKITQTSKSRKWNILSFLGPGSPSCLCCGASLLLQLNQGNETFYALGLETFSASGWPIFFFCSGNKKEKYGTIWFTAVDETEQVRRILGLNEADGKQHAKLSNTWRKMDLGTWMLVGGAVHFCYYKGFDAMEMLS